jgi:hypothetical protein
MSATGLYTTEEIYRLLPSVYRVRDAEQGGVLRELIDVVTDQVNVLAESLEQLYDDEFVETCAAWAAPYIGDLIGYRTLHGVLPDIASPRAEVANTIRYRRRKGTVPVLEQLALDVTGWPARAVEFFELLATTQFMNHIRLHAAATASLRDEGRLELVAAFQGGRFQAGAFDSFAHTAEMRRIPTRAGRYNIQNVGIFLWRVQALRLVRSPLVDADDPAGGVRYRFDPLGTDKPLFNPRRTEQEITHIAEPLDVPIPLPRRFAKKHLRDLYGTGRALLLETEDATGVEPVAQIRICDLSDDPAVPGTWIHQPQPADTHVAVDPVLGRVAFPAAPAAGDERLATFHYGSALAIGGGGYDRAASLERMETVVTVSDGDSLTAPLTAVKAGGAVQILDSRRYAAPATITANTPGAGPGDRVLALRSSNRARPLLERGEQLKLAMEPDTTIVLDGIVLAGAPLVIEESADTEARHLVLRHCTLVPGITRDPDGDPHSVGRASLIVLHPFASVKLEHCVVGPVVAVEGVEVDASDSVIDASAEDEVAFCGRAPAASGLLGVSSAAERETGDGLEPGGHLTLESCTVLGKVHAQRLDVSNSLLLARLAAADPWPAPVWAERRQVGCMRFSFVPPGSRTPRRFHCVGADPAHRPSHTSLRYGDPGYMQLRRSTHAAVRTGASDEGSMGVTHELHEPQRETNLRIRMDEYLRYGLEAGFFYAT